MINEILEVSKLAPVRHPYQVLAKLMEEVGELAQEINIREGFLNKPVGKDGVIGEGVDAINCIIDIIYLYEPDITMGELNKINIAKLEKWKSFFTKSVENANTNK